MRTEKGEEKPIMLLLPDDPKWRGLLQIKVEQYDNWFSSEEMRYQPPEVRDTSKKGYARRIINDLFKDGGVDTWSTSLRLAEEHGNAFNVENFEKACALVDRYTSDMAALQVSIERFNHSR